MLTNPQDDEETLAAQEEAELREAGRGRDVAVKEEMDDLAAEADLPLEELLARCVVFPSLCSISPV
jgi:hypothetical protein